MEKLGREYTDYTQFGGDWQKVLVGNKSVLYLTELNSSAAKTSLGVTVGMSCDDVKALYGTPSGEVASPSGISCKRCSA